MITTVLDTSPTDVRTCEACWRNPVGVVRKDADGRALLCVPCAQAGYARRVDLFPPLGIYGLTKRLAGRPPRQLGFKPGTGPMEMNDGKHGGGTPQTPPNPGPALPSPPPTPSPPGTPPV
ncbi:hypothetical protein [Streptomyces liangshanensis]|uniref:hypothetical protein n=1 Tax=Streptomyces liangshanensis TaxID=2717324 RepID=UPI0036DDC843